MAEVGRPSSAGSVRRFARVSVVRVVLALVAFVAAYTFVFWFAFALVPLE